METTEFDVLIVGAGLSGIGAAYHLTKNCPRRSFVILEARERIGGTWDLFRYPGVRSDSDMYTLGYSFKPWTGEKSIADGHSIREYIEETARENGILPKIRFGRQVVSASFSTEEARWTIKVLNKETGEEETYRAQFLHSCAGYYDYDEGYTPEYPGRENFKGTFIHPQFWDESLEYDGKRIVIIGSGATAITLLPSLAERAAHTVMLQRSPTYLVTLPERDPLRKTLTKYMSEDAAASIIRLKNIAGSMALYNYTRRFPEAAKRFLIGQIRKRVGDVVDVDEHFTPRYNPWDERLCVVPDSDLFRSIREGKASVVTDEIERFVEDGIELKSGNKLEADIIISATGLKLKFLGGIQVEIDGETINPADTMTYKGMMCSDVPNLSFVVGYTNASWTLKADLANEYLCRVLNHMEEHGYAIYCPRRDDPRLKEEPLLDLQSGYVKRAAHLMPKQGSFAPFKLHQNYALDFINFRRSRIDDGYMEFKRAPSLKTKSDQQEAAAAGRSA